MGNFWELRISAILKGCNKLQMLDGSDLAYPDMLINVRCCRCHQVMEAYVGSHSSLPAVFYPNNILYADDDLTDREKETFQRLASENCGFASVDHCLVCHQVMWIVWYATGPPLETQGGDRESTSDGQLVMFYMHGAEPTSDDDYDLSQISQWQVERTVDGKLFDDVVLVDGFASSIGSDNSSTNDAANDDDSDNSSTNDAADDDRDKNDNGGGGGGDPSWELKSARAYFIKLNYDDVI